MQLDKLKALLTLHEGREDSAYQDSLGYWTIGIGHLIDKRKGGKLPAHIVDALFEYDVGEAIKHLPDWVDSLDEVRQAVLVDMCFNLGPEPFDSDGLADWPQFVAQVRRGDYELAAANMRQTRWARQVKSRAIRLSQMMETGNWPSDLTDA